MKPDVLHLTTNQLKHVFSGYCGNPKCPVCGVKNDEIRELKTITKVKQ